ncbi:MAG: DUF1653 domain-containing protein [Arcobacter sp.]|nr:MAG: DUF1653 domain-containing protein [Arcobacter sp.]
MIQKNKIYTHYKNKEDYLVKDFCKIQDNDTWVQAVLYCPVNETLLFVRSLKEFQEKFSPKNK